MVGHPNIHIMTQTDYEDVKHIVPHRRVIYTGPIDEYFDFRFGKLPYRSLRFEHVTLDQQWHQPVGVVNYPQTNDYTRVTEYKHLTGQEHSKTALTYEYPSAEGDPYYPIPKPENQELFKKYERLALSTRTSGSWAGWRPIATTTWTRSSVRPSPRSGGSMRRFHREPIRRTSKSCLHRPLWLHNRKMYRTNPR